MPYWRNFYHLVWATDDPLSLIGEAEEAIIWRSFTLTLNDLEVIPHAIGFMPDHVHLVVSIPPKVAAADVVRRLKGAATHAVNERLARGENGRFSWQGEYGMLTFGEGTLKRVVAYVENQPRHHAEMRLWPTLERIAEERHSVAHPPPSEK